MYIDFRYDEFQQKDVLTGDMLVLFVLSGQAGLTMRDETTMLGPEEFAVINPYDMYVLWHERGTHLVTAHIPESLLREYGIGRADCISVRQSGRRDYLQELRSRLAIIFEEYLEERPDDLMILSSLMRFLAVLQRYFPESSSDTSAPGAASRGALPAGKRSDEERIGDALSYIRSNCDRDISIRDVAEHLYLSPSHLSREFDRVLGIHFSDYLRNVRVREAAALLLATKNTITEISEQAGFGNVNTMISAFRKTFGMTPGAYRRAYEGSQENPGHPATPRERAFYVALLKYADQANIPSRTLSGSRLSKEVSVDLGSTCGTLSGAGLLSIDLSLAGTYFRPEIPPLYRQCIREIGFRYLFTQGILDDVLSVYHLSPDGKPWYNFTYLDMVMDGILDMGVLPWIELGRTPESLVAHRQNTFMNGYVQLPSDLSAWAELVRSVLAHFCQRYGADHVRQWRISVFPPLYMHYGVFTPGEYDAYHLATFRAVREVLGDVCIIGGTFDMGYLREDDSPLRTFLRFCIDHDCVPDEIGLQMFHNDYSHKPREEIGKNLHAEGTTRVEEPAPPVRDPDCLRHDLAHLRALLDSLGLSDVRLCLVYWNSTVWNADLASDTCFKAAFLVKNILENQDLVSAMNYSSVIDQTLPGESRLFAGAMGYLTSSGIPKAAYNAYRLLSMMERTIVDRTSCSCVTRSGDGTRITIMLYHYCHYRFDMHLDDVLPRHEQLSIDRYIGFENPGTLDVQLTLRHLPSGTWQKESYIVNRDEGSSYDIWRKIGTPDEDTDYVKHYLSSLSCPGYRCERISSDGVHDIRISSVLEPHEVRLIVLTRSEAASEELS